MGIKEILTQFGDSLSLSGVPGTATAGQLLSIGLSPPLGLLSITDVVNQPIDADLIAKQVVFTDKDFTKAGWTEKPDIAKILPLFNLATVPPGLDASGVSGLVAKLKGTIPVPTQIAPEIRITWKVTDGKDQPLVSGQDFMAPNGLNKPSLAIAFLPALVPLKVGLPPPAVRRIAAQVTISAGGQSWSGTIGPVQVLVPAVPIPRIVALTVDSNFQNAALIVVPSDVGLGSVDQLRDVLKPVHDLLNTLTQVAQIAEMLTGIDTLVNILNAAHIEFRQATTINNLNDITLIQNNWYTNDIEAEDELSSFVYISPPKQKIEMCVARNLKTGEGRFEVETGNSFVALCPSLHSKKPAVSPASATLTVTKNPSDNFGDELSSIRFL